MKAFMCREWFDVNFFYDGCIFQMHSLHSMVIVDEASVRYGDKYMAVQANHFDICKPNSKLDTSFLYLVECIHIVVEKNASSLLALLEFSVEIEERMRKLQSKLEVNVVVVLVGMGYRKDNFEQIPLQSRAKKL